MGKTKGKKKKEKVITTRVITGRFKEVDGFVDGKPAGGVMKVVASKTSVKREGLVRNKLYISGTTGGRNLQFHRTEKMATRRFPRISPILRKKL